MDWMNVNLKLFLVLINSMNLFHKSLAQKANCLFIFPVNLSLAQPLHQCLFFGDIKKISGIYTIRKCGEQPRVFIASCGRQWDGG